MWQCTTVSCFVAVMDSHKMKEDGSWSSGYTLSEKNYHGVAIVAGHKGQVCT